MLLYILTGIVSFLVLWWMFAQSMWMENNADRIPWLLKPFAYVFIGFFLLGDALWNILFGTLLFQQWPDIHKGMNFSNATLSHRLRQILLGDTDIEKMDKRYRVALFICQYCIEPWDKNHCGLEDLK